MIMNESMFKKLFDFTANIMMGEHRIGEVDSCYKETGKGLVIANGRIIEVIEDAKQTQTPN